MAYYSGSANDMSAVHNALVESCLAEGWAFNSSTNVLSKGSVYLKVEVIAGYLSAIGRTSADSGDAPNAVRIGRIGAIEISWPAAWEVFVFDIEVYLVVNYRVDYYQWMAFGQSTITSLPGTGMWCAATGGGLTDPNNQLFITPTGGGTAGTDAKTCGAPFWATVAIEESGRNSFVHHNLGGRGWSLSLDGFYYAGAAALAPLIGLLPNTWNSEAVLLPIHAHAIRASQKVSKVASLVNARYTRVDHYLPGQVIALGNDRWKVFPFYRKDMSARDGGNNVAHSGSLGWAIRYEGP